MPCGSKKQKKSMSTKKKLGKKYEKGGKMIGPLHEDGGITINVEGGEFMINESVNGAATKHSKGLKNLNKNPDDYAIVPIIDSRKRRI